MLQANSSPASSAPAAAEFARDSEPQAHAPAGRLSRALRLWSAVENTIVALLAVMALGIVVYTIAVRLFVPSLTPSWADETTVYLVIWGIFIALSGVTAENRHVRADLLTSRLPERRQAQLELLSSVCGLIFAGILAWYGYQVARDAWEFGDLSTTTLRFPMWIYYAALPVGAALMSLRYALLIVLQATGSTLQKQRH